MAFTKKTWKDRQSQYPNRRKLLATSDPTVVEVAREEGTVTQAGDRFDAAGMNDLETRVANADKYLDENKLNIPQRVKAGTDINSITTPGMYWNNSIPEVVTMPNRPSGTAFSLFVEKHAGVSQTWTDYYPTAEFTVFRRNNHQATWGPWVKVYHSGSPQDIIVNAASGNSMKMYVNAVVRTTDTTGNVLLLAGTNVDGISVANGDTGAVPAHYTLTPFYQGGNWYCHVKDNLGTSFKSKPVRIIVTRFYYI